MQSHGQSMGPKRGRNVFYTLGSICEFLSHCSSLCLAPSSSLVQLVVYPHTLLGSSERNTYLLLSSLRWLETDVQTLRKGQWAFPNSSAPAFSLLASLSVHTQAFLSCKPLVSVSVLVSFPSSLGSPFPECGEDWCRLFQSSLYVWCYFKPLICRNSWIYLYHSLSEDKPINITLLQWCGLLCLDHTGSHSQGGYKAVFLAMGLHCLLCACREC